MGIINVLEESVYNLIAAGEVVERPASVIKELVENSIDAGAKNITIEIKNGGISYIRVTDDGCGIEPDDVGVAFLRHATSKIKDARDLYKIGTLGFRGEALCSIAAVSNVSLVSKTKTAKFATKVIVNGGCMEDVLNVGAPEGTTIEVKKLFFNTPARMKFLKKDATEAGYAAAVAEKFILSNPDISIKFINNGKQTLFSPGTRSGVDAIYSVYGKDYAKSLIEVNYTGEFMSVNGYIGKANISRPNRAYQSFFVNGRSIKSAVMTKALEEAYKNQIMIGKFPFAVLNLLVNFEAVDVNVHPHKTEVKFSDEKQVFETVYWAVKNALYEKPIIAEGEFEKKTAAKNAYAFEDKKENVKYETARIDFGEPKNVSYKSEMTDAKDVQKQTEIYIEKVLRPAVQIRNTAAGKKDLNVTFKSDMLCQGEPVITEQNKEQKTSEFLKEEILKPQNIVKEETLQEDSEDIKEDLACTNEVKEEKSDSAENDTADDFKICGCVFDTYIIVQKDQQMLLIDQHAAHERIKYEQIKKDIEKNGVISQSLICAAPVNLTAAEYEYALSHTEELKKIGFEYEDMEFKKVVLNAVPYELCEADYTGAFVEILGEAMDNKMQLITKDYERALYTVACKAAIKANHALDESEMIRLTEDVFKMKNINTCPHGRPIIVSFSKKEIEKQFKRIV